MIIKNDQGYLLTLRNFTGKDLWHLPGATVYLGESPIKTAERVIEEELGVKGTVQEFINYIDYPSTIETNGFGHAISLVFECTLKNYKFKLDELAHRYKFFKKIPKNTIVEQKEFIEKLQISN